MAATTLAVSALGLGVTYYFSREAQLDAVRSEHADVSGGDVTLTFTDSEDNTCSLSYTFMAPTATCSPSNLSWTSLQKRRGPIP